MSNAELRRLEYLSPRHIMLEKLQKYVRTPAADEPKADYFLPYPASSPLTPYLR